MNKKGVAGFSNLHSFNFVYTFSPEEGGETVRGNFTVRRPSIMDRTSIEAEKLRMLGGFHFDPDNPGAGAPEFANNLADASSFLRVLVVDAPDWWDLDTLESMDLLGRIYREASKADPFRKPAAEKSPSGSGQGGDGEHGISFLDDDIAAMVDE